MTTLLASLIVIALAQLAVLVLQGNKIKELTTENVNLRLHNLELYRKTMEQSIQITTLNMQIELQKALVTSAELDIKIHEIKIASLREDLSKASEAMRSSITSFSLSN
jgi:hypothetical protein